MNLILLITFFVVYRKFGTPLISDRMSNIFIQERISTGSFDANE